MTSTALRRFLMATTVLTALTVAVPPPDATAQPVPAASAPVAASDGGWPRIFTGAEATVTVYQPQIDSWSGNQLTSRAAVQVVRTGTTQPSFGVIWFTAATDVDKTQRLVTLRNIKIDKASFPTDATNVAAYEGIVNQNIPVTMTISLDRLEANLAIAKNENPQKPIAVKNEPPRIIVATDPSALVLIDGQPALRATSDAAITRIINTRALVFFDQKKNRYYLRIMGRWAAASSLDGSWSVAKNPPSVIDDIRQSLAADSYDKLTGTLTEAQAAGQPLPKVLVATGPAELIQINGQPQYQPIPGTQLLEVSNTTSDVILNLADNNQYLLISGRWFKGQGLNGPWTYVANNALPADFANIPPNHPRGEVLPAVSGTPQAQEAVIAAQVPQTATVVKANVKFSATYDSGKPVWGPIDGTNLSYAANSPQPVIRISQNSYMAVSNGIWFQSVSPFGPWAVATAVPPVIYSIPPSAPVYYVTGVQVYGGTPDFVYVGYTPVYMGTVIAPAGTVVFGTGYYYPPYIGPTAFYPPPATYGYGAGFASGALTGFTFGFVAGALMSTMWGGPYHCCGPMYGNVTVNNFNNVYNRWGNNNVLRNDSDVNRYLNNHPEARQQLQHDQNRDVRQINRDLARDPQAKANAQKYMSNHPNASNAWNNAEQQQRQDRQQAATTAKSDAQSYKNNDLYAGKDGNVYRQGQNGWEKPESGNQWKPDSSQQQDLQREQQARQDGNARYSAARQAPAWHGGGAARGGWRR